MLDSIIGMSFSIIKISSFHQSFLIKIHGSVLVAKKAMWHTSVLFTRTSISTTSAYCSQKIMGDNLYYDVGAIFNRSHCQTRLAPKVC